MYNNFSDPDLPVTFLAGPLNINFCLCNPQNLALHELLTSITNMDTTGNQSNV